MDETWQGRDVFNYSGFDLGGRSVSLFAQQVSVETPELTLPRGFRKGAECVSVFTRKQRAFICIGIPCR